MSGHDPLYSIIAAMWVEYNRDQECDYLRVNRLLEDAAGFMLHIFTMDEFTALGKAHIDDPRWAAIAEERQLDVDDGSEDGAVSLRSIALREAVYDATETELTDQEAIDVLTAVDAVDPLRRKSP